MHTITDCVYVHLCCLPILLHEKKWQCNDWFHWHSGNSSELWSNIHSTNDTSDTTLLSSVVVETEQFDDPPAEQTSATTLLAFPDSWVMSARTTFNHLMQWSLMISLPSRWLASPAGASTAGNKRGHVWENPSLWCDATFMLASCLRGRRDCLSC